MTSLLELTARAPADAAVAERELRALQSAGKRHGPARQWLLTLTRDRAPVEHPARITVEGWILGLA